MKRFASFAEFYPFYLSEHSNRTSRRLHFVGSCGVLVLLAVAVATADARCSARLGALGRQRRHARNPARSAASQVAWKRTFSRRGRRAAHDGRQ